MSPSQPITALIRSESSSARARVALAFGPRAGGDLLWVAHVPEGLRNGFRRFAAEADPSKDPACPYRVAWLDDAPPLGDLDLLARVIRDRGKNANGEAPLPDGVSASVRPVAEEIRTGRLHPTALILDVHHLPLLVGSIRSERLTAKAAPRTHASAEALNRYALSRLRALLDEFRAAGLHVLILSPLPAVRVRPKGVAAPPDLDAAILDPLAAEADLSLVVQPTAVPTWDDLLPGTPTEESWSERLARTCPRIGEVREESLAESVAPWRDETQEEFARWAEGRGWTVTPASAEQDRREHWDVVIARDGEIYRIDVKARSRLRRRDVLPQDEWHWVELRGIVDDGWLFGGRAEFIAFQTADTFLLVRRTDLIAHVRHHVDPESRVSRQSEAEYRVYHRRDRGESGPRRLTGADRGVLTLVPMARLRVLAWDERPAPRPKAIRKRAKRADAVAAIR